MPITCGQVLQQIGCPHAAKERKLQIAYPADLANETGLQSVTIVQKGCSFCDVAKDKGYMRADYFLKGFLTLEKTLESARHKNIRAIRNLKPKFPYHFGYLKEEGANHGFIHPTPWDTPEISREINRNIPMYQLAMDILPNHSTPLIIHHASGGVPFLSYPIHKFNTLD